MEQNMNDELVEGARVQPVLTAADLATMLSAKRRVFADQMLADPSMSRTEAAIAAGYSPASAASEASQLLRNETVLAYIGACLREGLGMGVDALKFDVLQRLHAIASHDPRRALSVTTMNRVVEREDGSTVVEPVPVVAVKDSKDWDDKTAMAVSEVVSQGGKVGIKFYDKQQALGALAKIVKLVESGGQRALAAQARATAADGSVAEVRVVYVEGGTDGPEGLVE